MGRGKAKGKGGFTLPEMLAVVAVIGIMTAIVAPRMTLWAAIIRTRGATNRIAADLAYTRQVAARTGSRARLVLERSADCPAPPGWTAGHRYRVIRAGRDSIVAQRDLRLDGAPLCMASNGPGPVEFRSTGVLVGFDNRTIVVRQDAYPPDTLTLSAVGRVRRRY
jgi:prepilin-type N-terminal cleavage/methylation domain-containing protein